MRFPVLIRLAAVFALGSGAALAGDDFIDKIVEAHGAADKYGEAEYWELWGVLKFVGGSFQKYDYKVTARMPGDYRLRLEGMQGTFGSSGRLVLGARGWKFAREAFRPMAPDEVAESKRDLRDHFWLWQLKKGALKFERLEDSTFGEVACASIRLIEPEGGREVKLHFDKETWLLYRRDEVITGRAGEQTSYYTLYEAYEEIEGVQVALDRRTYRNQRVPGRDQEDFRLVNKVAVDDETFSPELDEGCFQPPEDPFVVAGVTDEAVEARAETLLKYFEGRRDPHMAGWACRGLAALEAESAIKTLIDAEKKEKRHYGFLARIRMGSEEDLPSAYRASDWKEKVADFMGYDEGAVTGLDVHFVGASGVRLESNGMVVFVNAFYQPRLFHRPYPSLEAGAVDEAQLLLYTHAHRDVFDPWETAKVLSRTEAKAAGPPTVIRLLEKQGVAGDRLIVLEPEKGKPVEIKEKGVKVKALAVAHGGKFTKEGVPEHVVYVVGMGEKSAVHFGNATKPKGKEEVAEAMKGADVMFLTPGALIIKNQEFLKMASPRFLVPLMAPDTPGAFGSLQNFREDFPKVVPLLPGHDVEF